nr:hypothetical protein CFP56_44294 [Quercus suber]
MPADQHARSEDAVEGNEDINIALAKKRLAQESQRAMPLPTERKIHDITTDFARATRTLQRGQLVKDDLFTLFEAVGALEVRCPLLMSFRENTNCLCRSWTPRWIAVSYLTGTASCQNLMFVHLDTYQR